MPYATRLSTAQRAIAYPALAIALLCLPTVSSSSDKEPLRIVVLSLDGMADWLFDELMEAGELPNLRRLAVMGLVAEHAYTSWPAMTAPGHTVIWTGTDPSRNGINGNTILPSPFAEHTILDSAGGFSGAYLMAEPIWAAAARQGKRVVVLEAHQAEPLDTYFGRYARFPAPEENLLIFGRVYPPLLRDELIDESIGFDRAEGWINLPPHDGDLKSFNKTFGQTRLYFLVYDDPADPVKGKDTLLICRGPDGEAQAAALKPGPAAQGSAARYSGQIEIRVAGEKHYTFFRLFELSPDAGRLLLLQTIVNGPRCSEPEVSARFREAGAFNIGNAASELYTRGEFGKTIMAGGDGRAERRYMETVRHSINRSKALVAHAMRELSWDLVIAYTPFPDEQNHMWLGYFAQPSGDAESDIGKALRPLVVETCQLCDELVGVAIDNLPNDAVLFVVSDHGFSGVDRNVYPNTALRKAGLLSLNEQGEVDPSRTKAMCFVGDGSWLVVNSGRFKGGIVPDADVAEVKRGAAEALLAARDGEGRRIVLQVIDPLVDRGYDLSGPYGGDLYIHFAPRYYPSGAYNRKVVAEPIPPCGAHFGDPRQRPMNSILLIGGKAIAGGREIGKVSAIDIAPTISGLMGIAPPRHATGEALPISMKAQDQQ